jgi:hypothetical protein
MSTSVEAHHVDCGISRRTSLAPTIKSTITEHKEDSIAKDDKPKGKHLYLTFGGLQLALFLAALDR